jgi:hypothetical protein
MCDKNKGISFDQIYPNELIIPHISVKTGNPSENIT